MKWGREFIKWVFQKSDHKIWKFSGPWWDNHLKIKQSPNHFSRVQPQNTMVTECLMPQLNILHWAIVNSSKLLFTMAVYIFLYLNVWVRKFGFNTCVIYMKSLSNQVIKHAHIHSYKLSAMTDLIL